MQPVGRSRQQLGQHQLSRTAYLKFIQNGAPASQMQFLQHANWVHANGGITNGGVACVGAKWRVFVHFCAFLRFFVRFCAFFPAKLGFKKAQISAEFCKNVQKALLCNTPFSYTPFCVSPSKWRLRCLLVMVSSRCRLTRSFMISKLRYAVPIRVAWQQSMQASCQRTTHSRLSDPRHLATTNC